MDCVTIPEGDRDPALGLKLRAEAEGILAWAIAGARQYASIGSAGVIQVRAATATYRVESDVLGMWLEERCDLSDPRGTTPSGELFRDFKTWCEANGQSFGNANKFGRLLSDRGIEARQVGGGVRARIGVRLVRGGDEDGRH